MVNVLVSAFNPTYTNKNCNLQHDQRGKIDRKGKIQKYMDIKRQKKKLTKKAKELLELEFCIDVKIWRVELVTKGENG